MKTSIRTKFTLGILFLFVIILVLSIFSAFFLNRMSKKTGAILKENYLSIVFARDMAEGLTNINQEITSHYVTIRNTNSSLVMNELGQVEKSLQDEKNNLTEPGEDELVSGIESGLGQYRDSVIQFMKSPKPAAGILYLRKEYIVLYQQLMLLSQMNEKAIEHKTEDAKTSAKSALIQMSILGTICFLIALSFTFQFASYFNERFFQLYHGIREIVSSNYGQRLHFEGNDEFHEISLIFNKMAEKLDENMEKMSLSGKIDTVKESNFNDVQELKRLLARLKGFEEQSVALISRLESKE